MRAGKITAAAQAFAESLTHADRLGDVREELATRWMLATAITLGPAPVPECISRCEEPAVVPHISQTAAQLSLLLRAEGRRDEADSLANLSAQTAPADGVAAQALSRAATARAASDAGDHREALRLAGEAVRLAPEEMPNLRGDVLTQLAVAMRASGQSRGAETAAAEAAHLYERKGRTVTAADAGCILDGGF